MGIDPVAGDENVGTVEVCDRCDVGGIKPVAITLVAGVGCNINLFISINQSIISVSLYCNITVQMQIKLNFILMTRPLNILHIWIRFYRPLSRLRTRYCNFYDFGQNVCTLGLVRTTKIVCRNLFLWSTLLNLSDKQSTTQ